MDHNDEAGDERNDGATEQVEDYLRLEEHIEQLQADRRPRRPGRLTPEQVRVYQTAALFRAAAPGAAEPDPTFVAQLRARLEREMGQGRGTRRQSRSPIVSRRGLLAGGLTAAAAAAAGVAAGVVLERDTASPASTTWNTPLVLSGAGTWVAVAAVETIPVGSVRRFVTDQAVGFVRHTASGFEALSGACTHMGCLVAWNGAARTFDCPCHGGRFLEDGWPAPTSPVAYKPLPSIFTRVENGQVWVYLPTPDASGPDPNNSTLHSYP